MILAACTYVVLIAVVVCFQICMAAGAPWGHLANGGRWPGRLPSGMRVAALAQAGVLIFMGWAVAGRAGLIADVPGWCFWLALGLTGATTLANLITPSAPERRVWGPVTVVLLVTVLRVAWG